jgi:uncharacterized protein
VIRNSDRLLFSATDLVNFLGCGHASFLDLRQLRSPVELPPPDPQAALLQEKGLEHERAYLAALKERGLHVAEIDAELPLEQRVALTREAMTAGAEVIYQGALIAPPWHGYSDFLTRVDEPSGFGAWSYEPSDTKLSRSAKPKHVVQLCVYAALVGLEQGCLPGRMHIMLGDGSTVSLNVAEFFHYFAVARARFERFCAVPPEASAGEPCGHCTFCRWLDLCEADWQAGDHLSLVARITKSQRQKLTENGITTMGALAGLAPGTRVPALHADTFERLRSQARLQVARRDDGGNRHKLLPRVPGKGFNRLPEPDDGDLFFDMEGDPLFEDGGLEYLFGFVHGEPGGEVRFTSFWAHERAEEKVAFERALDFIVERLARYPRAHIYHYGSYEETALKRLAMYHGTRETEIDNLLRGRKLVDLYKVVREGLQISEPSYSLKNLEVFFGDRRRGEVTTAGDSIVIYERWRRLRDPQLLDEIGAYNETDCRSTRSCRGWLLSLRPVDATWFTGMVTDEDAGKASKRAARRREMDAKMIAMTTALLAGVGETDRPWRELVAHLLEFHRREAKPAWWAMFARLEMSEEELVDDAECIGGLRRDPGRLPYPVKQSIVHSFRFPAQDFKMVVGDEPLRADTGKVAGEIVALDEEACTIALRVGRKKTLPDQLSVIPQGPIGDEALRAAIYRYAQTVVAGRDDRYAAVTAILQRAPPRVAGTAAGGPLISSDADPVTGAIDVLSRLDRSYLLIQGPPGTGKTSVSSHAIVELLRRGHRVGVSSLSHKAINHLLRQVERIAVERGVTFSGIKKSSSDDQRYGGTLIEDTNDNNVACVEAYQLVAGTAWLFAREALDHEFDYLFVDEAGQVSLANIVAMGLSARNIVLVGDQMQLSQPIRGTHPGSSGLSALEYLLGDVATVPPDRGIFLMQTRRMNAEVCRFISDAVYDGRLQPVQGNERQRLILRPGSDEALAPTGLGFVGVDHSGCAQKSLEEAERIRRIYDSVLGASWIDADGVAHQIGTGEILVVSPYNMQVNLLRSTLPPGARVGTVDKFQGQEAPVVIVSMATSSGDDMPRNLEFLFSRNRLNVAISRARCLAVIVASPRLLEVPCSKVEQMKLVNTLCWASRHSNQ